MKIKRPRSFLGYILCGLAAWVLISAAAVVFFDDRLTRSQAPKVEFVETPNFLCIGPDQQSVTLNMVEVADFQRLAFKSPLSPLAASDDDKAVSYDTVALAMAPAPYAAFVVDAECIRIGMAVPISKPMDEATIADIDCAALRGLKKQRHYGSEQIEVIARELKNRDVEHADITARRAANLYTCDGG